MYDHVLNKWTRMQNTLDRMTDFGCAAFSNKEGILVGGRGGNTAYKQQVHLYHMDKGWSHVADLPFG